MLKGDRCMSPKCAVVKRPYIPGQHGPNARIKLSEYGKQLREKQKAKKIFGISEGQLSIYYKEAEKCEGNTAENLLTLLESRIDNVIHRSGIVKSHATARQLASHGNIKLNNKKITTPSIQTKAGDIVEYPKSYALESNSKSLVPNWISIDDSKKTITVKHNPSREEIDLNINENLIIEFYSR